jgi:hypothetical protein
VKDIDLLITADSGMAFFEGDLLFLDLREADLRDLEGIAIIFYSGFFLLFSLLKISNPGFFLSACIQAAILGSSGNKSPYNKKCTKFKTS